MDLSTFQLFCLAMRNSLFSFNRKTLACGVNFKVLTEDEKRRALCNLKMLAVASQL